MRFIKATFFFGVELFCDATTDMTTLSAAYVRWGCTVQE
jgi:hypothetical protein